MRWGNGFLLVFFLGMVALLTCLRFLYPNLGAREDDSWSKRASSLSVVCSPAEHAVVRQVANAYELEYGVRIDLLAWDSRKRRDLAIGSGGIEMPEVGDEAVSRFTVPLPVAATNADPGALWQLAVYSSSEHSCRETHRFVRYLTARDRGLTYVSSPGISDLPGDLWVEDPKPLLVVDRASYPFILPELKRFEATEGIRLRLLVGPQAFIDKKIAEGGEFDAIIGLEESGQESSIPGFWSAPIPGRQVVCLTLNDRSQQLGVAGESHPATRLGIVTNSRKVFEDRRFSAGQSRTLAQEIGRSTVVSLGDPGKLLGAVLTGEVDVGMAVVWPEALSDSRLKLEPVPNRQVYVALSVRESSDYRRVLAQRLFAKLSLSEP